MFKGDSIFYFATIRRMIVSFGTLFSDVKIGRRDINNVVLKTIPIPFAYSEGEKWVLFNQEHVFEPKSITSNNQADVKLKLETTYPRMSYEFTGIQPDWTRKTNTLRNVIRTNANNPQAFVKQLVPVPYDFSFVLTIVVKNADDGFQILEQILPNFTPSFNMTVIDIPELGIEHDVPVIIGNIEKESEYQGAISEERVTKWRITFVAKGYLYPIIRDAEVIKKVIANLWNYYNTHKKLAEVDVNVDPMSAGINDTYTIATHIYEDTQLDSNGNPINPILNAITPGIYDIVGYTAGSVHDKQINASYGIYTLTGNAVDLNLVSSEVLLEGFENFNTGTMIGDLLDNNSNPVVWTPYEYPSGVANGSTDELVISMTNLGATEGSEALRLQYNVISTPHGGGYFSFDTATNAGAHLDLSPYSEIWVDITVRSIAPADRIWFFDWFAGEPGKGDGSPGHKVGTPTGQTGTFTLKFLIDPIYQGAPSLNSALFFENDEGYLNTAGDTYDISIDNIRGILL